MNHYLYLFIDLACISVPLIASFYKPHAFYKEWKYFFPANIVVAAVYIVWDVIFTRQGVWGFEPHYLLGLNFINLPVEEVLFFICIPYACVFTYFAFQYLLRNVKLLGKDRWVTGVLVLVTLVLGLLHIDKMYSAASFLLAAVYLGVHWIRRTNLELFYWSFIPILFFFFISNGILTGSFLEKPVVWYNNDENMGIRMWTIPVEDLFYGMILILANIDLMNWFKRRSQT